jgi:dihydroorotate dehydrogenase electron transfer subunit
MNDAPVQPGLNSDGTITAVVAAPPRLANGALNLALALPPRLQAERMAGRFVLARCGAQDEGERAGQWSIYLRRPLYVAGPPPAGVHAAQSWRLWAPAAATRDGGGSDPGGDPGYAWLAGRSVGETVNLTGPFGNGFALPPLVRRLLLLAEPARLPLLAPLIDVALDRGGQVSVLLLETEGGEADVGALRGDLPFSVELHTLAGGEWANGLAASLHWADQLCAALPPADLPRLAESVRQARRRLESGFAFCLLEADLACGYGACLACVVPLANGSLTRACVHGPVFDLLEIAGG